MAISYSYNTAQNTLQEIYNVSSGGTVWSANITTSIDLDYFGDSAVADDAIYFTRSNNSAQVSDFTFNVGTAMAGVDIVLIWEYAKRQDDGSTDWSEFEDLEDDTNSFTTTGSNRVKFPLQWRPSTMTLNGLARTWFRCRIVSLTSISEGGANQTDRVKCSDGKLTVSGSEITPVSTFTDIYDWIVANNSYISVSRSRTGTFDFTKVAIALSGRTESFQEIIELGQDCKTNTTVGANNLNYLTSGKKSGTRGYDGSTFILSGRGNSRICTLGDNSKIYGCSFKKGPSEAGTGNYPGYFVIKGDVVDSNFEVSPSSGSFPSPMDNVKLTSGIVISTSMSQELSDLTYMCGASSMFYTVPANTAGWTITNFEYGWLPSITNAQLHYFYAYCTRSDAYINLNYVNPVTPLGSYSDTKKPYSRTVNGPYDLTAVKWYRDSGGTFENYTTEAGDATPDNLPLSGEVGDILYFYHSSYNSYPDANFYLKRTDTDNDYEYIWEYYNTTEGWKDMGLTGSGFNDGTEGLSITGYRLGSWYHPTLERRATTTIDGTSAYWMRLRITSKGTGTPMATNLQLLRVYGAGNWAINQKYSMDFKIVDSNGDAIEEATVTCNYSDGTEVFSVDSDASGETEQQIVLNKSFIPNGHAEYKGARLVKETEYTTFNLLITKAGYGTHRLDNLPFDGKVDWTIKLGAGTETKINNSTINNSTIY